MAIGDDELRELQAAVLAAVTERRPLPGGTAPVDLPDLALAMRGREILVAEENLAGQLPNEVAGKPVRIVTHDALLEAGSADPQAAYVSFGPPEEVDGEVVFRLEARPASAAAGGPVLGLGGLVVRFRRTAEGWEAAGDPAYYAA